MFHATWAIANLAVSLGRPSTMWRRLVRPLDKTGTGVARSARELRPVSYVDEMEGLVDALWLRAEKDKLQEFAGEEQAGGQYDPLLMVLGIVITLQARREVGLPSWLVAEDLLHGYDLGWRDGVRVQASGAGVGGRAWLYLDAQLERENVVLRLGGMLGHMVQICNVGIGQGRRSGVQLFGALTAGLKDQVEEECRPPVAVVRPEVLEGLRDAPPQDPGIESGWDPEDAQLDRLAAQGHQEGWGRQQWAQAFQALPSGAARCRLLDRLGAPGPMLTQFVDDGLAVQSSLHGVRAVGRAMDRFITQWAHAFAGGKKGPWVLGVNAAPPEGGWVGTVDGRPLQVVDNDEPALSLLGVLGDGSLSFEPLLRKVLGLRASKTREVAAGLQSSGLGLPYQVDQLNSRVHQTVLQGSELLASYGKGWRAAAAALTRGQYPQRRTSWASPGTGSWAAMRGCSWN